MTTSINCARCFQPTGPEQLLCSDCLTNDDLHDVRIGNSGPVPARFCYRVTSTGRIARCSAQMPGILYLHFWDNERNAWTPATTFAQAEVEHWPQRQIIALAA